jgi:hypothetical protein
MFQECRHIKASGTKCQAPALKDEKFCYFHTRSRAHAKRHVDHWEAIDIPLLEDRSAIQRALSEVANAIANNRIDPKRAGLLLYSLQIASQNAKNQAEIVGGGLQVREVTQSEDGIDLGPEVTSEENTDENPLAAIMDFYRKEMATDLTDPKQNSL